MFWVSIPTGKITAHGSFRFPESGVRYFQSKGFKKGVFFFPDRYAASEVSVCLVELLKMNGGGAMGCERNLLVKSRWVSLKLGNNNLRNFMAVSTLFSRPSAVLSPSGNILQRPTRRVVIKAQPHKWQPYYFDWLTVIDTLASFLHGGSMWKGCWGYIRWGALDEGEAVESYHLWCGWEKEAGWSGKGGTERTLRSPQWGGCHTN